MYMFARQISSLNDYFVLVEPGGGEDFLGVLESNKQIKGVGLS